MFFSFDDANMDVFQFFSRKFDFVIVDRQVPGTANQAKNTVISPKLAPFNVGNPLSRWLPNST
jgi:hypothetical protein